MHGDLFSAMARPSREGRMHCGCNEANADQFSTVDDVSPEEGAPQLLVEERQTDIHDSLTPYNITCITLFKMLWCN